jgi:hypothetical protein
VMDDLSAHKAEKVNKELIERKATASFLEPAALLAGLQPHRGSFLEDQGCCAQGREARTREALVVRPTARRSLYGHGPGRS